jgi:hypothetical protein
LTNDCTGLRRLVAMVSPVNLAHNAAGRDCYQLPGERIPRCALR